MDTKGCEGWLTVGREVEKRGQNNELIIAELTHQSRRLFNPDADRYYVAVKWPNSHDPRAAIVGRQPKS